MGIIFFMVMALAFFGQVSFACPSGLNGSGTIQDPCQITNCTQLQNAGTDFFSYWNYTLMNDIDCSDTVNWNSGAGFDPIGDSINMFRSSFDGRGHAISNLFINRSAENYVGLFGYVYQGNVTNVNVVGANMTSNGYGGGLAGVLDRGSVINCSVTGTLLGSYNYVGGLVGYEYYSNVLNSYANVNVGGASYVGGLSGLSYLSVVNNSGASGNVIYSNRYVGGLVGHNQGGTVENSYAKGNVTQNNSAMVGQVGGLVGYNFISSGTSIIRKSYATGVVSSSSNATGGLVGHFYNGIIENSYATGNVSGTSFIGGLIGWLEAGNTVSNCYATGNVTATGARIGGLIGHSYSKIFDSFSTGTVTGGSEVGGLVGRSQGGNITHGYWNNVGTPAVCVGSDTGVTDCTAISSNISYFYAVNNAPISSWNFTNTWGELPGNFPHLLWEDNFVIDCGRLQNIKNNLGLTVVVKNDIDCNIAPYNTGLGFEPIGNSTNSFSGIFMGRNYRITGLYINRTSQSNVGLFGSLSTSSNISDIGLVNARITGSVNVGGLAGQVLGDVNSVGRVSNAYVTGNVSATNYVGGLIGYNNGNITSSYSTAKVSPNPTSGDYGGGLAGYNSGNGAITNCYATGSISSADQYIGGLVGYNNGGKINGSYASGNVTAHGDVGGLVGLNFVGGLINNSFASGSVTIGYWDYSVGGLVGRNSARIDNSYATGKVSGGDRTGGLVGWHTSSGISISNSFSTGNVTAGQGPNAGGLIGQKEAAATISNNYWNNRTGVPVNCTGNAGNPAGCTAIQDNQNYFYVVGNAPITSWNFAAIWDNSYNNVYYPPLQWQSQYEVPISSCVTLNITDTKYILGQSVNASGTCFTIANNSVTLDCNGYGINYSQSATGYGVIVTGYNGTVVKNCNITQATAQSNSHGIYLASGTTYCIIRDNNVTIVGGSGSLGIYVYSSSNNTVTRNNIPNAYYYGIATFLSSYNNVTYNNVNSTDGYGMLVSSSTFTTVSYNNVFTTWHGVMFSAASNNTFMYNNVTSNTSVALYLNPGNYTNVSYNTITSRDNYALYVKSSLYNSFSYNNITSINAYAVLLHEAVGGTTPHFNTFLSNNFTSIKSQAIEADWSSNNTFNNSIIRGNTSYFRAYLANDNIITNTTFMNDNGSVQYPQRINFPSGLMLTTSKLNITWNSTINSPTVYLDTSDAAVNSTFNKSAQLTLKGLSFSAAAPTVDYANNGTFVLCQPDRCQNIMYNSMTGTLTFNVTSFSTYSSRENATGTCTPPGSGNWLINCADNCTWISNQVVPGNVTIYNAGQLELIANFTFSSSNQYLEINTSGCVFYIHSGSGFR